MIPVAAFCTSGALGLSGSSGFIGILECSHQYFQHLYIAEVSFRYSPVNIHDIILLLLQAG